MRASNARVPEPFAALCKLSGAAHAEDDVK